MGDSKVQSTDAHRSWTMSQVRSKNTSPEIQVRKLVYNLGFKYQLHRKDLPGSPDLAFVSRKKVIFVHGCFWHRHCRPTCRLTRTPKSRPDFWKKKFSNNTARDQKNIHDLLMRGWSVLIIWECELANVALTKREIRLFLQ
ncbi:very short patch repair endonuclease [Rhizobium leguminosarum]|uniref:very short patch repair endonuclease n=1 Tax=Rhizobium leguminosarum TaxID=384 RepID=UPI003F977DA9